MDIFGTAFFLELSAGLWLLRYQNKYLKWDCVKNCDNKLKHTDFCPPYYAFWERMIMAITREKCIETDCTKSVQNNLNNLLISPFEDGTKDTQKLFSFFLHSAPNVESVHSKRIPEAKHSALFHSMMDSRHFKYQKFCWAQTPIEKELSNACLDGGNICLKCKRFVCKRKQVIKGETVETDLECFLRHIRNSIAHGRVYYRYTVNRLHIVFEDKNTSGKISARIVCIKADLEHWKRILSNPENFSLTL